MVQYTLVFLMFIKRLMYIEYISFLKLPNEFTINFEFSEDILNKSLNIT
jgi:hypothetical protein